MIQACLHDYAMRSALRGLMNANLGNVRFWHGTDLHGRYAGPKLLLSRDINAAIKFTYRRLSNCWEKLVDGGLITDFIENREQGRESFPGL